MRKIGEEELEKFVLFVIARSDSDEAIHKQLKKNWIASHTLAMTEKYSNDFYF